MNEVVVKIGFVPSYRFSFSPWCTRMYEESLAALRGVKGLELVAPRPSPDGSTVDAEGGLTPHGAIHTLDQAEAVADYYAREKVDGLIICALDFADERSAAKIAERLRVPVLLYATKEPPARNDASLARVSDSYCGNLALAAALHRRKLPFRYAGLFMPDEPGLLEEVDEFVRAVAVVQGLLGARVGQVGLRPESFESCEFSERAMIWKFGQNLICRELSQIVAAAGAFADDAPEVLALVEEIRQGAATVRVSGEHLTRAAKMELALMEFWTSAGLSTMAVQCWPAVQQSMGISLCGVFSRLTQRGMLTACEADVLGALAMLVNHRAALGETVPHLVDWTIQHREDPSRLLAWHCGNAPLCLAADSHETALRSRSDMTGEEPIPELGAQEGLYEFQLQAGEVTFCRLAEFGGEWKMLIARGEILPSEERLAGTWSWVRVPDHDRLYRILVEEGFIHHASMIHGDQRVPLRRACEFLDIRPIVVD